MIIKYNIIDYLGFQVLVTYKQGETTQFTDIYRYFQCSYKTDQGAAERIDCKPSSPL
jgi:hypothetical protein